MTDKIAWGIIGCGRIAGIFAKGIAQSKTGRLLAAASRSEEKAGRFGDEHHAERRYGSYEALLADPDVAAVYVATPHTQHVEWTVRAAEAGKHVLCEKPLALTRADAARSVEAARRANVFLMEAFMYRCHPQTAKLVELVRGGAVGEVRMLRAAFGYRANFDPKGRLFDKTLGGGGILDVGCYPVSMARLVAGAAAGRDFADPVEVVGAGELTETGVDAHAAAVLRFEGGLVAEVATAVDVRLENDVRVFGSEGSIHVAQPWQPGRFGEPKIIVRAKGKDEPREFAFSGDADLYGLEADAVAESIKAREAPAMRLDDSLGNMKALDAWRAAVGVVYDADESAG